MQFRKELFQLKDRLSRFLNGISLKMDYRNHRIVATSNILKIFLSLYARLEYPYKDNRAYSVSINQEAKDFIAEKGFDSKFGARPLKRAIQKYFEDSLSEKIISAKIKQGDKIKVSLKKDKSELEIKIVKKKIKQKKIEK